MDLWSSILSGQDSKTELDPPLYIHPMAKKRTLSDESLEICTESLGSETGSDGYDFVSDPPRTTTPPPQRIKNSGDSKKPDLLPPPLPSQSLQLRCRRQDGRLVMEAVEVAPFESCFRAERQDGRLLLSFESVEQESNNMADRDDDVGGQDDEVAEVSSSGFMSDSKPFVYEYLRSKLQPCKRSLILILKETTALPILSNI